MNEHFFHFKRRNQPRRSYNTRKIFKQIESLIYTMLSNVTRRINK